MGIFDFGALKSASAALEDQRTKLEAELARINAGLEALRREREDLIETPVLNSDLADGLCGLVDAQAAEYADELRTSLEPFRRSPAAVAHQATPEMFTVDRIMKTLARRDGVLPVLRAAEGGWSNGIQEQALLYFFGDTIKAGIRRAVEGFDDAGAIALSERPKRLEANSKKIATLTAQLGDLKQNALTAGFMVRYNQKVEPMTDAERRQYAAQLAAGA
ncbi:MAG: hypothetical protein H6953_11735 [Chromatiaceae bacterium]|nr:hypothetical protein [Chromatiaceae bacterium]MCP5315982.1 hypothetical protein [Chromatiaceae bacterium]